MLLDVMVTVPPKSFWIPVPFSVILLLVMVKVPRRFLTPSNWLPRTTLLMSRQVEPTSQRTPASAASPPPVDP